VQRFEFDEPELDYLMRALFQRPPAFQADVKTCGEIIAHFCGMGENCRRILLEAIQPGHFAEESRPVLNAAARAILESGAGFAPAALSEIRDFMESRRMGRPASETTPTNERLRNADRRRRGESWIERYEDWKLPIFIVVIVLGLIVLMIVGVSAHKST
jgi:hypothetical protein